MGHLELWFEYLGKPFPPHSPPSYDSFLIKNKTEVGNASVFSQICRLRLTGEPVAPRSRWQSLICRNEIWELWLDDDQYVFTNPLQDVVRKVVVNQDFNAGLLFGEFAADQRLLPQDLEIVLFVNWLANFGDVILHAAACAHDGRGMVFAGESGAGKSTLAAALHSDPTLTILGEDQVLLRFLGGQFWLFGTPWHENPAMCSPLGVPLDRVYFLDKNGSPGIQPLTPTSGIASLLQSAFIPYYRPEAVEAILDRLILLAGQTPFHSLSYPLGSNVGAMLADHWSA